MFIVGTMAATFGVSAAGIGVAGVTAAGVGFGFGIGWGTILTAASVAYQIGQARKMRKAAREAAEARKGYELVAEASSSPLPIVYGRALIGGVRVWHKTSSIFEWDTPNSDRNFNIGPPEQLAGVRKVVKYGPDGNETIEEVPYDAIPAGLLTQRRVSEKNQFLMFQQALCQGEINGVYDVIFNDSMGLDDPTLGNYEGTPDAITALKAALRIDCFNGGIPKADAVMVANDASRVDSKFPNAAYASVTIKLDRDEPQFNSVPSVQFFIEGRKVRSISSGSLSGSTTYSNNPALCLLDYLLDTSCGKGISPSQIDFASFESAAAICNTPVLENAVVGGRIWRPVTTTLRNVGVRTIPLYECNTVIDVSKPIRDNVETLLSTMGDARLVWSQGKYKLLLQYPLTNEEIVLAGALTDDDLIMDDQIDINWPSSNERLNYAIVRYHNEAMDFKEDSVAWPPKKAGTYSKGVGSDTYPTVSGWDEKYDGGKLLNEYGVWSGIEQNSTMSWTFMAKKVGTYTYKLTADDGVTVTGLPGGTITHTGKHAWRTVEEGSFVVGTADTKLSLTAAVIDTGVKKGFAASITGPDGLQIWTSRYPAYTDFITITQTSAVYDAMLAEDNGVQLESDFFAEGITDYYHALAKAEELVRMSRTAFTIGFKYIIKDKYFEPGDIIKLTSSTLKFEDEIFIRVNEAKIENGLVCSITGSRFDWTQLAWNVADDEYLKPRNPYVEKLAAPAWVNYDPASAYIAGSAGTVTWAEVADPRVVNYAIYINKSGDNITASDTDNTGYTTGAIGYPNMREIATVSKPPFELPALAFAVGRVGVKAVSKKGSKSSMTLSTSFAVDVEGTRRVDIAASGIVFSQTAPDTIVPATLKLTAKIFGFKSPVFTWYREEADGSGWETVAHDVDKPRELTVPSTDLANLTTRQYKVNVGELGYANNELDEDDTITLHRLTADGGFQLDFDNRWMNFTANAAGVVDPSQYTASSMYNHVYVARGLEIFGPDDPRLLITSNSVDQTGLAYSPNVPHGDGKLVYMMADPPGEHPYFRVTNYDGDLISGYIQVHVHYRETEVDPWVEVATGQIGISKSFAEHPITPRIPRIVANSVAFVTPKNGGTVTPTQIVLSNMSDGYDDPVLTWYDAQDTFATDNDDPIPDPTNPAIPWHGNTLTILPIHIPVNGHKLVRMQISEDGETADQNDYISIYHLKEGDDAINFAIGEENTFYPADENGNLTHPPANGQPLGKHDLLVARGSVLLSSPSEVTYAVTDSLGFTPAPTIVNNNKVQYMGFTDAATDSAWAEVEATVVANGTKIKKKLQATKTKQGVKGAASKLVEINGSDIVFVRAKNGGAAAPTQITLTATSKNFIPTSWVWTKWVSGVQDTSFVPTYPVPADHSKISIPPAPTVGNETYKVVVDGDSTLSDSMTVPTIREGDDSLNALLTNENQTVAATSTGAFAAATTITSTMFVARGSNVLSSGVTYTVVSSTFSGAPATASWINSSTGAITIPLTATLMPDAMLNASVKFRATVGTATLDRELTISKSKQGGGGSNAQSVDITGTALVFVVKKDGSVTPTPSLTLTANTQNVTNPTYAWYLGSSTTVIDTNQSITLLSSTHMTEGSKTYKVVVNGDTSISDVVTVPTIREGSDSLNALLSNENQTIASTSSGTITPTVVTSQMFVARGDVVLPNGSVTYTVASTTLSGGVVASWINSSGIISLTVNSTNMPDAMLNAEVVFRATVGSSVLERKLTLSKSKQGSGGGPGANAQSVDITGNGLAFIVKKTGEVIPTAGITLTATCQNVTAPDYKWYSGNGTTWSLISAASGQPTLARTAAQHSTEGNQSFKVTVDAAGLVFDVITIPTIREGSDSINVLLINENQTVSADFSGNILDTSQIITSAVLVYAGTTDVLGFNSGYTCTISASPSWNITQGASPFIDSKGNISIPVTQLVNGNDDKYSLTINVQIANALTGVGIATIQRMLTINKSRNGLNGSPGNPGETGPNGKKVIKDYIYNIADKAVPTTSYQYNMSMPINSRFTPALTDGWTEVPPTASGTQKQSWAVPFSVTETVAGGEIGTVVFGAKTQATNFSGLVTFSELGTENGASTKIHGSNITTGTIISNDGEFGIGTGASMFSYKSVISAVARNPSGGQYVGGMFANAKYGYAFAGVGNYDPYYMEGADAVAYRYHVNPWDNPNVTRILPGVPAMSVSCIAPLNGNANNTDNELLYTNSIFSQKNQAAAFYYRPYEWVRGFTAVPARINDLDQDQNIRYLVRVAFEDTVEYKGGALQARYFANRNLTEWGDKESVHEVMLCSHTRAIDIKGNGWINGHLLSFTGAHAAVLEDYLVPVLGDIYEDAFIISNTDINGSNAKVTRSTAAYSKRVLGVFSGDLQDYVRRPEGVAAASGFAAASMVISFKGISLNALGEGLINVCGENGNITAGDLLVTSALAGKGMRQSDDIIRSYTVAKARETVTFSSPTEVKLIACIYMCG